MAATDPLSIRQLEVFVALVEQGSFTKAARHLGLSQSTVSGHMADLERRLGVRLVERDRAGTLPTEAGDVLLVPAREALRAERNARHAAEQIVGLLRGHLHVGGSTIPAVYVLPKHLATFHAEHPDVEITVHTGDSADIVARIRGGEVDVGIIGAPPDDASGLTVSPFGGDTLHLVVAPTHRLAKERRLSVAKLADVPMVRRESGSGTQAAIDAALATAGLPADTPTACRVGSTEAVKAAVRAGLGAAIISDLAVEVDLAAKHLVAIELEGVSLDRTFHLVAREAERMSPAGRAFHAGLAPSTARKGRR